MLRDLLENQSLVSIEPHETVSKAARLMAEKNVGTVLVLTNGKPRGILTDRDIVLRCIAKNLDVSDTTVENVMSESVLNCKDTEGLYDCIKAMSRSGVRRVPVIDSAGKALGIISFSDVARVLAKEFAILAESTTSVGATVRDKSEKKIA